MICRKKRITHPKSRCKEFYELVKSTDKMKLAGWGEQLLV